MQKIIFLYGPSCAGKSVIAEEILKEENFIHVHYDRIKWFISDYSRDKTQYKPFVIDIMSTLIEKSQKQGFSILIEGIPCDLFEKIQQQYEKTAKILPIKVTANTEILKSRFQERIKSAQDSDRKISNTSLDVFMELLEFYNKAPEYGITIDTSEISIEETKAKVGSYIHSL